MRLAILSASIMFVHGCTVAPYVATPKSEFLPVPQEFLPEDKLSFKDHPESREFSSLQPISWPPMRRAQSRNLDGVVAVNFGIDKEGAPFNIHILYVSSDQDMLPGFKYFISKKLSKEKFMPSTLNGQPVVTHNVTYLYTQCINFEGDRSIVSHRELACEGVDGYEKFRDSLEKPEMGFTLN